MAKRYDLDMGKRRARKRLRDFIKKTIFNRKHANVLCFPGEYGTEIEDVYRKLGFRDHNIYGIERDKKAAKAIEERYPEAIIYQGDLIDFVRGYDGPKFDVVSLDFCGKANEKKFRVLALMAVHEMFADKCVIHFNVMAGREPKDLQDGLRNCYARILLDRKGLGYGKEFESTEDGMSPLQEVLDEANVEELGRVREDAITQQLQAVLGYHTCAMRVCGLFDLKEYRGSLVQMPTGAKIKERIKGENGEVKLVIEGAYAADESALVTAMAIKNQAIHDINWLLREAKVPDFLKEEVRVFQRTGKKVLRDFDPALLDYHFGRGLVMFYFDKYGAALIPTKMERYSYVSASGRRMITDITLFQSFQEALDKIPDPIFPSKQNEGEEGDHRFCLHWPEIYQNDPKAWIKWLQRIHSRYATVAAQYSMCLPAKWPERIDLGGGTVIMTEEQVKERIIGYIKRGRENEYIRRKFPTLKKGRLAAIRAHVTMGTY